MQKFDIIYLHFFQKYIENLFKIILVEKLDHYL